MHFYYVAVFAVFIFHWSLGAYTLDASCSHTSNGTRHLGAHTEHRCELTRAHARARSSERKHMIHLTTPLNTARYMRSGIIIIEPIRHTFFCSPFICRCRRCRRTDDRQRSKWRKKNEIKSEVNTFVRRKHLEQPIIWQKTCTLHRHTHTYIQLCIESDNDNWHWNSSFTCNHCNAIK